MLSSATLQHGRSASNKGWSVWFCPGVRRVRPACWIGVPAGPPQRPPLVVVHGILRDAEGTFDLFSDYASAQQRVLIAPLFDERHWKGYQRVLGQQRADLGLIEILDGLRREAVISGRRVELFGYSAGAQFAHRFAFFHPQRVARLTVCAAGWYLFPDDAPYPRGLGQPVHKLEGYSQIVRANLHEFVYLPIRVVVGDQDVIVDEHTRSSEALDSQQGHTRVERARNWVGSLERIAASVGCSPPLELEVLPGCGHDLRECLRAGALPDWTVSGRPVSGNKPTIVSNPRTVVEGCSHG